MNEEKFNVFWLLNNAAYKLIISKTFIFYCDSHWISLLGAILFLQNRLLDYNSPPPQIIFGLGFQLARQAITFVESGS